MTQKNNNGFALALAPETSADAMKVADWLSKTEMIPERYKGRPHDIVVAAAMGARLGLDTFRALAGIAVIKGTPTIYGDTMLAVCQQHPEYHGMEVEFSNEGTDEERCEVTILRGDSRYTARFSIKDAKTAGLWGKAGPWTQYPRRMLEMRARSYALRGAFADALAGFQSREEVEDSDELPTEHRSRRRGNQQEPSVTLDDLKEADATVRDETGQTDLVDQLEEEPPFGDEE